MIRRERLFFDTFVIKLFPVENCAPKEQHTLRKPL